MPPETQFSNAYMQRWLTWGQITSVVGLSLGILAVIITITIWPTSQKAPTYESTGPGVIRAYSDRTLVHESDSGYIKMMNVCGTAAVWPRMHANLAFHWTNSENATGCYHIDSIQRLGPDYE